MATILITDDALFMRMKLKEVLTKMGHEIVGEAANGREAVEKYKALRPQIVTMDITMPEMGGIAAVKEIMNIDAEANVIMCSAMGQQAMLMEAMQNGAKDFVVKPFSDERIREAIEKAVQPAVC